jgi:hypothetical protein
LLIAREAVDRHLLAASDLLTPGGDLKTKADAARRGAPAVLLQVAATAGCRPAGKPSSNKSSRSSAASSTSAPSCSRSPQRLLCRHEREQPERKTEALELAHLFCQQAKRRADTIFDELWTHDDDPNHAAQRVLTARYTWREDAASSRDASLALSGNQNAEEVPAAGKVD